LNRAAELVPVAATVVVAAAVVAVTTVAAPVTLFIPLEVPGRSASASGALVILRHAAIVAVLRIKVIIYMAVEVI